MNWMDNDPLFKRLLQEGHDWEGYVAHAIGLHGVDVSWKDKLSVRECLAHVERYANEKDIVITSGPHRGEFLEVKSRGFAFGEEPWAYPYQDTFIESVGSTLGRTCGMPLYWVLVSQETGSMLSLARATFARWQVRSDIHDKVRDIVGDPTWTCDKSLLSGFWNMIADLGGRLPGSSAVEPSPVKRPRAGSIPAPAAT